MLRSPLLPPPCLTAGLAAGSVAVLVAGCSLLPPPDVPTVPTGQAVPVDPQRVVVLDADVTLEPVLALGLPVVAAPSPNVTGGFSSSVEPFLDDVTDLGPLAGLSGEAVAVADPDVIITNPAVGEADLAGETRTVSSADWVFGGVLSAMAILDDVEQWYR